MSDVLSNRAKEILRSALARKPEESRRFLVEACRDGLTLLSQVEAHGRAQPEGAAGRLLAFFGLGAVGVIPWSGRDDSSFLSLLRADDYLNCPIRLSTLRSRDFIR
jgi:hypothetical protein